MSESDSRTLVHFEHLPDPKWHRVGTEPIPPGEFVVVDSVVRRITCGARYQANPRAGPNEVTSGCC